MKKRITYYDILGITESATIDEIKKAYRQKAKEIHPDINGNSDTANMKMALLNKAYRTLIDPLTRQQYDKRLEKISLINSQKKEKKNYSPNPVKNTNNYSSAPGKNTMPAGGFSIGRWGIVIFIILLLLGLNFLLQTKTHSNTTPVPTTPSPAVNDSSGINDQQQNDPFTDPTAASEPTIDCTGPDGKHLFITQKACDNFNNAWKPTPIFTPNPVPLQQQPVDEQSQNNQPTPENSCGLNSYLSQGIYCSCNPGYRKNHNTGNCEKRVYTQ